VYDGVFFGFKKVKISQNKSRKLVVCKPLKRMPAKGYSRFTGTYKRYNYRPVRSLIIPRLFN